MTELAKRIARNLSLFLSVLYTVLTFELATHHARDTGVKVAAFQKDQAGYQVVLRFDAPMKPMASILCNCEVVKSFWTDPFSLNLTIRMGAEADALSLTINPQFHRGKFMTIYDETLPTSVVSVGIGE